MMRKNIMGRVFLLAGDTGGGIEAQRQMNIFAVWNLANWQLEAEKKVERIFGKYKIYILYIIYTMKIWNSFKIKNRHFRQGRLWEVKRGYPVKKRIRGRSDVRISGKIPAQG